MQCIQDECRADSDLDGVPDETDTCPGQENPGQMDTDRDGIGDLCDNCPEVANPDQNDACNLLDMYERWMGGLNNDTCERCALNARDGLGNIMPDVDDSFNASIHQPRDVDYYCFDAADSLFPPFQISPERIRIELTNVPAGQDYDVELYRGQVDCVDGRALERGLNAGNADERIVWTETNANDSGRYYIKVYGVGDSHSRNSHYQLRVEGLK